MAGRGLIIGSALCMWDDVEAALDLCEFDAVIAAKRAGVVWPGNLDAWVTLHPERLDQDIKARRQRGFPRAKCVYSHKSTAGQQYTTHQIEYKLPKQRTSGSSGLFAVKVALEEFRLTRLVLCGIPMDKTFGRIDDKNKIWAGADAFRPAFMDVFDDLRPFVRSMSGWTAMKFGKPTTEWIMEGVS